MDYLPIAIGQAGNQINYELSKILFMNQNVEVDNIFTINNSMIKSFAIDSEIKVLNKYLSDDQLKKYYILDKNLIKNSSGRGNNWALGYDIEFKEFKQEKSLVQDAFEKLENFIEKCDFLKGFLFIHSMYGGTGSGVTTRMIEMLRDEYPKFEIFDIAINGMNIEKTTLSCYNKFFTIGHIYDKVDNILMINNEKIKKEIEMISSNSSLLNKDKTKYSFENMNLIIAKIIYNFTKHSKDFKYDFYFRKYYEDIKIIDASFCEFDHVLNDFDFRKHVRNNFYSTDDLEQENKIITADYLLENSSGKSSAFRVEDYINKLESMYNPYVSNAMCLNNSKNIKLNKTQLTTFIKNFQHKNLLEEELEIIQEKIRSRAFLFWYEKHGITNQDFYEMFYNYDNILNSYSMFG